jgi:hypothetical protein
MAFNPCDLTWASLRRTYSRRIARHKDQKDSCAVANADSQTPQEKSDPHSIARNFAETKESFADSVSKSVSEKQIKAQKTIRHTRTRRKSITNSSGNTTASAFRQSRFRKKSLAQRESFAG